MARPYIKIKEVRIEADGFWSGLVVFALTLCVAVYMVIAFIVILVLQILFWVYSTLTWPFRAIDARRRAKRALQLRGIR